MPYAENPKSKINTSGPQFYGDTSTIRFDLWNTFLSVKIHPLKEDNSKGGVYNYQVRTSLVLSMEHCSYLGDFILNELIPAIKKNEAKSLGLQASKVNMLYISSGVAETGHVEPYIGVFCDINESKKPNKFDIFKFRKHRVFTSYKHETGEFATDETWFIELQWLGEFLKSVVLAAGAAVHGNDLAHAYEDDNDANFKMALGAKLGVQYKQQPSAQRYPAKADPWETGADAGVPTAPVNSVASLDDISNLASKSTVKKIKKILNQQ